MKTEESFPERNGHTFLLVIGEIMGILDSFLVPLEPYFNIVNDLPFSLKYYHFPQCHTNPYFNRSTKSI